MDLQDAIDKAGQILDEERHKPTVEYEQSPSYAAFAAAAAHHPLLDSRSWRPRAISENPEQFQYKSTNYDLLCAILDQVPEHDRPKLFATLRSRLSNARAFHRKSGTVREAGSSTHCSSELPLVAEFLVRRGDKQLFIRALSKAAPSPGLTLLLMQLEDMIAFNFTLFSDEEYAQLPTSIAGVRQTVADLQERPRPTSTIESNTIHHVLREVPELCDSVEEGCRKARYLYVKGSLLPGVNLEVNQDKSKVRSFLKKLGFTHLLIESLEEAERLYRTATTPFDHKSSMGHLRSFLEGLHLQACDRVNKKFGGSLPTKWGEALKYLRDHDVLSKSEEQFAAQFYVLMSDSGVHPLVAEREYARLMRNMSIEYGLLLLTKLDKLGLN
jgi:hypothetical protein